MLRPKKGEESEANSLNSFLGKWVTRNSKDLEGSETDMSSSEFLKDFINKEFQKVTAGL